MYGKIRLSRWLLAATVLVVAECTGAASLKIALPAAHAQLSSDFFRSSRARPQSDKFIRVTKLEAAPKHTPINRQLA
jgi:hypothetical protein